MGERTIRATCLSAHPRSRSDRHRGLIRIAAEPRILEAEQTVTSCRSTPPALRAAAIPLLRRRKDKPNVHDDHLSLASPVGQHRANWAGWQQQPHSAGRPASQLSRTRQCRVRHSPSRRRPDPIAPEPGDLADQPQLARTASRTRRAAPAHVVRLRLTNAEMNYATPDGRTADTSALTPALGAPLLAHQSTRPWPRPIRQDETMYVQPPASGHAGRGPESDQSRWSSIGRARAPLARVPAPPGGNRVCRISLCWGLRAGGRTRRQRARAGRPAGQ